MTVIRRWAIRTVIGAGIGTVVLLLAALSYGLYLSTFVAFREAMSTHPCCCSARRFCSTRSPPRGSHLIERLNRLGYREVGPRFIGRESFG